MAPTEFYELKNKLLLSHGMSVLRAIFFVINTLYVVDKDRM